MSQRIVCKSCEGKVPAIKELCTTCGGSGYAGGYLERTKRKPVTTRICSVCGGRGAGRTMPNGTPAHAECLKISMEGTSDATA